MAGAIFFPAAITPCQWFSNTGATSIMWRMPESNKQNYWKSKKGEQLAGSGQMILHDMLRHLTKGFRVGSLQLANWNSWNCRTSFRRQSGQV
jgi:hypothetical protein